MLLKKLGFRTKLNLFPLILQLLTHKRLVGHASMLKIFLKVQFSIVLVATTLLNYKLELNDPGVGLFRDFQRDWDNLAINYSNLNLLDYDSLPDWMLKEAKDVLDWANKEYLNNNWPRGDYKELVELLIIYLGGKIYNFKFRITGADHHARWMS